jgi:hypothetical protein
VVHLFADQGVQPDRLAMVGYGQFRRAEATTAKQAATANRRVVLIIMATPPPRHVETSNRFPAPHPPTTARHFAVMRISYPHDRRHGTER